MKALSDYISEAFITESKETFKLAWDKMCREKSPMFTFPNGEYCYVNYNEEADTLEAGSATNAGFKAETSVDCDYDHDLDWHLEGLYELMMEEHPEYAGDEEDND